ncbi:MAG: prolipoprotein diacylglyceryl transferase [Clostridiales bacterium]|jgi:phosphatidylglycerol:prolipoprotein diacylglycerol transferase|nr:prolipoprotein diacylglyceryl transferase [Clostridiales bacterium]
MSENQTESNDKKSKTAAFFDAVKTAAKKAGDAVKRFYTEKKAIAISISAALALLWLVLFSIRVNNGVPDNMIDPVAITVGPFPIRWYGIIIVGAMLLALALFVKMSKSIGLNDEDGITMFLICVPIGILCARIGYVLVHLSSYTPVNSLEDVISLFAIWDGGVTIMGGIPGGIIGVLIFAKKRKVKFFDVVGTAAIPLLLAQAIGRWCNFPNQEVYGGFVPEGLKFFETFPFGVFIADKGPTEYGWHYATFFYESILSFIGVALLLILYKKTKYRGTMIFGYLAWYFLSRALVESIRADAVPIVEGGGLSWGVLLSLIVFPIAVALGVIYYQNGSLKRLSFKRLPELPETLPAADESAPSAEQNPEAEARAEERKVKEKSETSKISDYNKKYYGNKKKK